MYYNVFHITNLLCVLRTIVRCFINKNFITACVCKTLDKQEKQTCTSVSKSVYADLRQLIRTSDMFYCYQSCLHCLCKRMKTTRTCAVRRAPCVVRRALRMRCAQHYFKRFTSNHVYRQTALRFSTRRLTYVT